MSSEELGLPSFLVGDVLIRHPDLVGLDSPAELFAVDAPEAQSAPRWGVFWAAAFRDAPPLPPAVRAQLPEEGGFVVRPLTKPMPSSVLLVEGRCLQAPRREVHAELGFPEPALVSNEVFAEVRYGLAPSVVQRLDFEDIREGTLRLFAIPGFEGDVRVVTLVDELAAKEVLAQIHHELTGGLHRKRLLEFLHAAAASPAAAKWPSSAEVTSGDFVESLLQRPTEPELRQSIPEGALFPHQVATVAWMQHIERQGRQSLQVEPFHFAGATLGSAYDLQLPLGGVVAHPPGSGKTRIVASLAAAGEREAPQPVAVPRGDGPPVVMGRRQWRWDHWLHYFCPCGMSLPLAQPPSAEVSPANRLAVQSTNPSRLKTLIVAPAHLLRQWREELEGQHSTDSEVMDYEAASELRGCEGWRRLVIDEPQDCPGATWSSLQRLADDFREAGVAVWQLCGTAKSQLDSIGPLLLGRQGWHIAWRQSEWTGCPQLAHLIRTRFLADPPWACLPRPRLEWHNEAVVLRPRESTDVGVANLAGFVLDSVLLLSFGAGMAFAAAQERDQLLLQMGWLSCVGTSLLPVEEHALADWEGIVQSRTKEKLEKIEKEIGKLEASESQQGQRYQLAGGDAALAPDLSFLSVETVRVAIEGLDETQASAGAAAEWNALLSSQGYQGPLVANAEPGAVLLQREVDDFAAACAEAEARGAVAVIFASNGAERPFGYHHDRAPPGIPACMVSSSFARELFNALDTSQTSRPLTATVTLLAQDCPEDDRDLEEGMVSAFIANDAVDTALHRQLKALRGERERCERSLRFARQMRHLLERNEAHCPVCFATGKEAEAFAVLPDCFHILCRGCLEQQAGMEPTFGCPMCRMSVFRLDVVVFKSPGIESKTEVEPDRSVSPQSRTEEAFCIASFQQREVLPSKLQRLLSLLQELLASPEERILVYTQWATHVVYLQEVLQQQGIASLALVGELRETMDVLSRFGCQGEPRVLLLSSQRHSSGINLQMARHVVIVHPYCTPTATSQESISRLQMLAFEAQAIGRVRRYPQKKTVHVHRLFAVGSVEEELYAR